MGRGGTIQEPAGAPRCSRPLAILRDLKLDGIPRILTLNKTDLAPDPSALAFAHSQAVFISAIHRPSLIPLVERIKSLL